MLHFSAIVDIYLFYDRAVDMQIWSLRTSLISMWPLRHLGLLFPTRYKLFIYINNRVLVNVVFDRNNIMYYRAINDWFCLRQTHCCLNCEFCLNGEPIMNKVRVQLKPCWHRECVLRITRRLMTTMSRTLKIKTSFASAHDKRKRNSAHIKISHLIFRFLKCW